MNKNLPVYSIPYFNRSQPQLYANNLREHLKDHQFTNQPHKHDFYLTVLFTSGSGVHEVDFKSYKVKAGAIFVLKPGQVHCWNLSADVNGFVFFHTRDFYEEHFSRQRLTDYHFFSGSSSLPLIYLKQPTFKSLKSSIKEIVFEFKSEKASRDTKIRALINLVYVELLRVYTTKSIVNNTTYFTLTQQFEQLLESNFRSMKLPKHYAALMNISEKHLNRVLRFSLNKTSTQVIAERLALESKRMLFYSGLNVNQIADEMGFNDTSYFIRFFKKWVGLSPLTFLKKYK